MPLASINGSTAAMDASVKLVVEKKAGRNMSGKLALVMEGSADTHTSRLLTSVNAASDGGGAVAPRATTAQPFAHHPSNSSHH